MGARNKDLLIMEDEMRAIADDLDCYGLMTAPMAAKVLVTEPLERAL